MSYCIIVDGYNAGRQFVRVLKSRGIDKTIHIQSTPTPIKSLIQPNLNEYTYSLVFDGNLDHLLQSIASVTHNAALMCVMAASEPGVMLADLLSEKLNLPTNGTNLSIARRNKFEMRNAVKDAGLAVPGYIRTANLSEALRWIASSTIFPVVAKPLASAGADQVFICNNEDEVSHAFNKILSSTSILGTESDAVLLEEFLEGEEYVVNSVSCQGKHRINDIWVYRKKHIDGGRKIYDREVLMDFDGPLQAQLTAYTHQVLNALGIQYGASHAEVIMTNRGPVLVEVGARISGATHIEVSQECVGHDAVNLTLDSYLEPAKFIKEMSIKNTISKYAMVIDLAIDFEGKLACERYKELVGHLESLRAMVVKVKPGDYLVKTSDLLSSPVKFHLVHNSFDQIEKDYQTIVSCANTAFILEPSLSMQDLANRWGAEYVAKGIPSSYRDEPSSVVSSFFYPYYLKNKKQQLTTAERVYDLGSGQGRNSIFFAQKGFEVVSYDLVEENMKRLQRYADEKGLTIKAISGDVTDTLLADDESVDIVIDIFCYKHQLDARRRMSYRNEISRILKTDGLYLLSLAGIEDGYYGPLCAEGSHVITDPYTGIGSVLFDVKDVKAEFQHYKILESQTIKKSGLMHGKEYERVTHAFIMSKDMAMTKASDMPSFKS